MSRNRLLDPTIPDALERAQDTLDSIGDAVVSTDVAGNVTYLNAVAEAMTGWSCAEACGRKSCGSSTRIPASRPGTRWRWRCVRTPRSA